MDRYVIAGNMFYEKWVGNRRACRTQLVNILCLAFVAVLLSADNAHAFEDQKYIDVCKKAMDYLEGDFGALLTALAGIGAIIASAVGGFKVAWSLIVVAVGCFILRNFILGGANGEGVGFFEGKC